MRKKGENLMQHYQVKPSKRKRTNRLVSHKRLMKSGEKRVTVKTKSRSATLSRHQAVRLPEETHVRKTKKTGSSVQATIPVSIVKNLNIEPGDSVAFIETNTGDVLFKKAEKKEELSNEFLLALQEGMDAYDDALKSLVNR